MNCIYANSWSMGVVGFLKRDDRIKLSNESEKKTELYLKIQKRNYKVDTTSMVTSLNFSPIQN